MLLPFGCWLRWLVIEHGVEEIVGVPGLQPNGAAICSLLASSAGTLSSLSWVRDGSVE
jgi:hypothetical protein